MGKKKIRRIIAREGLVIIGCITIGFVAHCLLPWFPKHFIPVPFRMLTVFERTCQLRDFIGVYVYCFYWLIRFIVWAVRVLKER